ncbi:MAG: ECF transporter S component [Clostridia bacterium]|nr:ECF transporter S component [Clostridia bacterium]
MKNSNKNMNMASVLNLTLTAIFLAIIIVMSFTPIGYLKMGTIEISLLAIPVAMGAALLGVGGGALLGLAFGVTSLIQCFGMSAFGTALFGINPALTAILCIVPRVLVGVASAWVYKVLKKKNVQPNVTSLISFLTAAVVNTVLFVGLFIAFFGNTDFYAGLETQFATTGVIAFFAAFVGVNGIVEAVASAAVGGALGSVIKKIEKQKAGFSKR